MRTIANCDTDFQARLIQGHLENEGIPSVILNEYINLTIPVPNASNMFAVQVAVNEENYEKALRIIESIDLNVGADVDFDDDADTEN